MTKSFSYIKYLYGGSKQVIYLELKKILYATLITTEKVQRHSEKLKLHVTDFKIINFNTV